MGQTGCGVGRSVVRLPGLAATGPGRLELGPPVRKSSGGISPVIVPRGEVLDRAVQADGVVGLDPRGDQGHRGRSTP